MNNITFKSRKRSSSLMLDQASSKELQEKSKRRMLEYRGAAEARKKPSSTTFTSDKDSSDMRIDDIVKRINGDVRFIDDEFIGPNDANYQRCDKNVYEINESNLPIVGKRLNSPAGVILDIKKSRDKTCLSLVVPEFVAQMFVKAAKDYKERLQETFDIVSAALKDYVIDLCMHSKLDAIEKRELISQRGRSRLVKSDGFSDYFNDWKSTDKFSSDESNIKHASVKILRMITKYGLDNTKLQSVFNVIDRLGVADIGLDEASNINISEELGLNTMYVPAVTKAEAILILADPYFRYYVAGMGVGSAKSVYYWDWVRNNADRLGLYKNSNNKWAQF